jgi:glycerate 2-kinase
VHGTGLGGRNQEFALVAALELQGLDGVCLLSAGTDGTDGPTDAAGAFVDGSTVTRAAARGLDANDFLRRQDSYTFLDALGALHRTGPTGTNVMDLAIGVCYQCRP